MKQPIALVGMACHYPDARSPAELWENVLWGRRAFRALPPERLRAESYVSADRSRPDSTYVSRAAVIEGYEFDRARFRVAASTFQATDLTHWLALEVAADALANAGRPEGDGLPRDRTGVLVGNSLAGEFSRANLMRLRWPYVLRVVDASLGERGWSADERRDFLRELEARYKAPFPPVGDETLAGGLSNTIAGRICNHFDLHGGGYTVDGACSSSLLAVANACSALAAGDLDVALAGGVDLSLDPFELVGFAMVGVLADDDMRVYDARPTGFWPGEGCGMVVLMRLEDALAAGLAVHATIQGWGVSSDGRGGLTRPEPEGQLLAIRRAFDRAGFGAHTVSYFEGHGTGTEMGDATELRGLSAAVRRSAEEGGRRAIDGPPAAIGSIKANMGHTKAAAGVAGLLKAVLAVDQRVLPPTTGCRTPHPELTGKAPVLRVLQHPESWPDGRPVRAGVNSMGFGGINVHVVLEGPEALERKGAPRRTSRSGRLRVESASQDAELFLLAGAGRGEVLETARRVARFAGRLSYSELTDLACELSRDLHGPYRASVVASSPVELAGRIEELVAHLERGGETDAGVAALDARAGMFAGRAAARARIGLLFPGQASPVYPDGGALARRFSLVRKIYEEAPLVRGGDPELTDVAQPAIAAASLAGSSVLDHLGIEADVAVGHSVGELAALQWAGVLDGSALLRIAAVRGRLMATLGSSGGAMAGIGAGRREVEALLSGEPVVVAGVNSDSQTVVSGDADAVRRVCRAAGAAGMAATVLPVSHAFHSSHMTGVAGAFAGELERERFDPPRRKVVSTVTGASLAAGADLRDILIRQLTSPVLFRDALRAADGDVDLWIEAGPGHVLAHLAGEQVSTPVVTLDAAGPSAVGFLSAAGAAFVAGASLRVDALFSDRFSRPFSLDWEPRFFTSPCELAPLPGPVAAECEAERAAPAAAACAGACAGEAAALPRGAPPLEVVRELVARKLELPVEKIHEDLRILADLHLNSICVREVVVSAARHLGLAPPRSVTEYANATVGELGQFLEEFSRTSMAEKSAAEGPPQGVDEWIREFTVEWRESGERPQSRAGEDAGSWRVLAPAGHPLAAPLREALSASDDGTDVAVCLPEEPDAASLELLLEGARLVLAGGAQRRLLLVHHGVGAAFAKTLHLESHGLAAGAVEVPPEVPEAAEWAAAEARALRGFCEVRYDAGGTRREPVLRPLAAAAGDGEPEPGPGDVLLVTGGGKGIAAECALALARRTGARLLLFGRSRPENDAALAANLRRMSAAGVAYEYHSADVTRPDAVVEAVCRGEASLGAVTGVIHGAGANAPRLIEALTVDAFRSTIAPKVDGLKNLLAALDTERLRWLITFSSIIGRCGLAGDADYALANEWLSVLTERFRESHPGCRSLALEWSVWSGLGMGERLGSVEALLSEGITPITPERGVKVFQEAIRRPSPAAPVVVAGRFGEPPTLEMESVELPLLRFLEKPRVHYPGVELVVDVSLSAENDPYLQDHQYAGQRLFPAVMMLEAMAQAAAALTGRDGPSGEGGAGSVPVFENVRFRRAIIVPETGSVTVRVAALAREDGRVEVVLRSEETEFQSDHAAAVCRFDRGDELFSGALSEAAPFAGTPSESVPLDPPSDLYGGLLFHRGRFRRLSGYRLLTATACVADLTPASRDDWFGWFVPRRLLLGDPGARDAAIHAIQACIPHARLLPIGVERIFSRGLDAGRAASIQARERRREGDLFVYDVAVFATDGTVLEAWEGLELRKVEGLHAKARGGARWVRPLLAPYLERRLEELVPGAHLDVALSGSRAAASRGILHHRPDGKPEAPGGKGISISRADGLTLAVAGEDPVGCDIELISPRQSSRWKDLLGGERFRLVELISREAGESIDTAASRVWTALECLKKTGASADMPLVLGSLAEDGWILLSSGQLSTGTYVTSVQGVEPSLAIAIVVSGHGKGV